MNGLKKFAVVDLETTGRSAVHHKIIEIAIILVDGDVIVETFHSFVNPETEIPYHISMLTGIHESMLKGAPKFYEIAKKIVHLLQDRIFVAHNVHFDFSFLRKEFSDLGFTLTGEKICTVREMRKHFPGLESYSLGKLTKHFGISHENKHRALSDAMATVHLLKKMREEQAQFETQTVLMPPELDQKALCLIPQSIGVYRFYDSYGTLLYVGKSKNLRQRVLSHFKVAFERKSEFDFKNKIAKVEYLETHSELAAFLIENEEIKSLRPLYNKRLRGQRIKYGIYLKKNTQGVFLSLDKIHQNERPLLELKSKKHGLHILQDFEAHTLEEVEEYFKKYQYPSQNFDLFDEKAMIRIRCQESFSIEVEIGEGENKGRIFKLADHPDLRQIILSFIRLKKPKMSHQTQSHC